MNVNRYQFDSIVSKTKKQISPIRKGQEDNYLNELALVEFRLYQFHEMFFLNSRHAQEIIQIILLDINAAIAGDTWDASPFEEACYPACVNEIEKYFFPAKNPELKKKLKNPCEIDEKYFELARKILIRIHESIEQWTKEYGSDGYFNFLSNYIKGEKYDDRSFLVEKEYLEE